MQQRLNKTIKNLKTINMKQKHKLWQNCWKATRSPMHWASKLWTKTNAAQGEHPKKQMEDAKQLLQRRWLFIDDICMLSATLLAEVDHNARHPVRSTCPQAARKTTSARSFDGYHVICSGDLLQLPPPDGGFMGDKKRA